MKDFVPFVSTTEMRLLNSSHAPSQENFVGYTCQWLSIIISGVFVWRNYHTWQSRQEVRKRFADKAPDRKFAALRHCRDGGVNTSIDRSHMHAQTHLHAHKMEEKSEGS